MPTVVELRDKCRKLHLGGCSKLNKAQLEARIKRHKNHSKKPSVKKPFAKKPSAKKPAREQKAREEARLKIKRAEQRRKREAERIRRVCESNLLIQC